MSFLQKPGSSITGTAVDPASPAGVIIDPLLELTQPGGPFPYGHAILTDGGGNYVIAPTLRPYIVGFTIVGGVPGGGLRFLDYQNVATLSAGFVLPFAANLMGISVAVDTVAVNSYNIEILRNPTVAAPIVLGTLSLDTGERTDFRRDLSVAIPAGAEIGARMVLSAGAGASAFLSGVVSVELEI
jgi:hypothetical protein